MKNREILSNPQANLQAATYSDAVLIPPGAFIMGTDFEPFYGSVLGPSEYAKPDETPMHAVYLEPYLIDRYPVTNAEYADFLQATDYPPPSHWKKGKHRPEEAARPVVYVSWQDASTYAQWARKRLPTEAEWEKAARGADGRAYPWGDEFEPSSGDEKKREETQQNRWRLWRNEDETKPPLNTEHEALVLITQILTSHPTPVGNRPATASPYGVHEMAGNVWEWTADWYQPYPGNSHKNRDYGETHKVLRGGSWLEVRDQTAKPYFRCANRLHIPPDSMASNIGFRCVRDVSSAEIQAYPPQVPIELLTKYVKQKKLKNLQTIQSKTERQSLQDFVIGCVLIGGGYVGMNTPKFAIVGFMVTVVGVGFLFSTGVNFWRRWKAASRLKRFRVDGS